MASYRGPGGRYVSRAEWQRSAAFLMAQQVNPASIMRDLSSQVDGQMKKKLTRYTRSLQRSVSLKEGMKPANKRVAAGARKAIIESYQSSGIGTRKSYRQNDTGKSKRYSGGAMEKALNSPAFTRATDSGIQIANKKLMDRKAKQWYRLNFGALPRSSNPPDVGSMKFPRSLGGRTSRQKAELVGFRPSKRFKVPNRGLGIWSNQFLDSSGGKEIRAIKNGTPGSGALYLLAAVKLKKTGRKTPVFNSTDTGPFRHHTSSGIQGKRFLDAGAAYINEHYPRELAKVITAWDKTSRRSLK